MNTNTINAELQLLAQEVLEAEIEYEYESYINSLVSLYYSQLAAEREYDRDAQAYGEL